MPAYNLGRLIAVKDSVGGWYFTPLLDFRRTPLLQPVRDIVPGNSPVPRAVARNAGSSHLLAACAILFLIALIFGTATSLLWARLHSQHHKTIIVLYALTMLITVLPNAGSLALAAYSRRSLGTVLHLITYCANNTSLITGIIAGGFLYRRAKRSTDVLQGG